VSDEVSPDQRTDAGAAVPAPRDDDLAARSTAVLRAVGAPAHDPGFWDDLDRTFADEPQLRLTPRSAIRPITQPPPVLDDRTVGRDVKVPPATAPAGRGRRLAVWVAAVALIALVIFGAVQGTGDDTQTDAGEDTASETARDTPEDPVDRDTPPPDDDPPDTTEDPEPTETEPEAALAPDDTLEPSGIGPLRVGAALRDLEAADVGISVDLLTFDGSGGTCFDASVHGSPDLTLRFRSPDPAVGVTDPMNAVLAAVGINAQAPTNRAVAGTGVGLATPQEQVLTAYAGNIIDAPHPYVPGGNVFVVPVGDGTGVAFGTDGRIVTSIAVGVQDVIQHIDGCG
jgi:hypothetical protein